MASEFRPLTAAEREILDRLLAEPFPGRDEAVSQLASCRVRRCDDEHCASLEFEVPNGDPIPNSAAHDVIVPVEGLAMDTDGIPIDILLFHRNGLLRDLEFVVYSDRMKRMPLAGEIEITRRD